MVVLGEAPEMPGQCLDPLRQERNLDFRGAGVALFRGEPTDDLLLLFPRERHSVLRHEVLLCGTFSLTGGWYQPNPGRANVGLRRRRTLPIGRVGTEEA